ncbi:MAG: DUF86 domain-containing protein [Chromatiales bacterium]|jgi:uncharacterized protein YutE (UPF0331/DUF86 family)|nr:DUF86 domain-containing protein [Chromatiales bacterium]MDX9767601.1 DUF86 domain-containing protein [Ectothiorhodospiraceae bacterium]
MDRSVVEAKLESLRRCLARVREKCPATAESLAQDPDLQDIVAINLTRAVQLGVDIGTHLIAGTESPAPATMGQTFDLLATRGIISADLAIRMKKAVGFRNIAVHNYEAIDWRIVHAIATVNIDDFERYAKVVAEHLPAD